MTTKTMFRITSDRYDTSIDEFVVIKETDKTVWFLYPGAKSASKELKKCDVHCWFDTKEEAFEHKKRGLISQIDYWQAQTDYIKEQLNKFKKKYPDLTRNSILNEII